MSPKDPIKKPAPASNRPPISNSSLLHVPDDALEGYQDRIYTGIDWNCTELAARHHRKLCMRQEIPCVTFLDAYKFKIKSSILHSFLDKKSKVSLQEQWEFLLPLTLWDNENFATEEGKICFQNSNCLTDNLLHIIKKAVRCDDRTVLKKELKKVSVLRLIDTRMTDFDKQLAEFKHLVTLNLCGNFIKELLPGVLPSGLRTLELQLNAIEDVTSIIENIPSDLLHLGLAKNLLNNGGLSGLCQLKYISVLDLSDNDIYDLSQLLDSLVHLPCLASLMLAGNPCSVCAVYSRVTIIRLPGLLWLDGREILARDRVITGVDPHPDDFLTNYFTFTVFRIMSAPQPPKPEKGATMTFHVELEIPLLDSVRRNFLMFRDNSHLIEMLPPPEDAYNSPTIMSQSTTMTESKSAADPEASSHESDIYKNLTVKNSRIIQNFTTFESNKVPWSKIMNFQEPCVRIFCPDLTALRDTFRTVVTVRLVFTLTTPIQKKTKSQSFIKPIPDQRLVLATIKCELRNPDWSQTSQHFHWDDSLETQNAIHWGDGDLSVLQYTQVQTKTPVKGKQEAEVNSVKQNTPENLTCHFGFGID